MAGEAATARGDRMAGIALLGVRIGAATGAHGTMRRKIPLLREALTGHFEDHHAFLAARMLTRVDALSADIDAVSEQIEEVIAPFARQVAQLDEIVGIGSRAAQDLIAEIGVDMTRFPTAAHLASWAKFAPMDKRSAGKGRAATTGKGNPYLAGTLGEVVAALSRTDTFLAARYQRLVKRRGKSRAIVAVGNSVLTVVWHLLSDPEAHFKDLGSGYYESKINKARRQASLTRQLEQLTGQKVELGPAA